MSVLVMNSQLSLIIFPFKVREGEFWALIGPNGSGKSTLINIILGLLKPASGSVKLFGADIGSFKHRERIGYVSQKSNSFNSGFPATVLEVVRSGLTRKVGLFKGFSKKDEQRALEALASSVWTILQNRILVNYPVVNSSVSL